MDLQDEYTDPSDGDTLEALSYTASEFGTHIEETGPKGKAKFQRRTDYHHACSLHGHTESHNVSLEVPQGDDKECMFKDGKDLLPASIG